MKSAGTTCLVTTAHISVIIGGRTDKNCGIENTLSSTELASSLEIRGAILSHDSFVANKDHFYRLFSQLFGSYSNYLYDSPFPRPPKAELTLSKEPVNTVPPPLPTATSKWTVEGHDLHLLLEIVVCFLRLHRNPMVPM